MFARAGRRLATSLLVLVALLFSQLALANYICPAGPAQPEAVMEMAPGQPCEGMESDANQPVLCHQHCAGAPQSSDAVKLPAVSIPAVLHVLTLPQGGPIAALAPRAHAAAADAHPPPEPVFLSTLRLRV